MRARFSHAMAAILAVLSSRASAQVTDLEELVDGPETDCVAAVHAPEIVVRATERRTIPDLRADACLSRLRDEGVAYEQLEVEGIAIPIRLTGSLGGVDIGDPRHRDTIDCRLAVAILSWAPALRAAGVRGLRYFSIHRPGARIAGSSRISGHARALAIDVAAFELDDGTELDVLNGWESRDHGTDPCTGPFEESEPSARLRRTICAAIRADLFQVVLTPHHDRAHANHVHLEVVPNVSWSFVR